MIKVKFAKSVMENEEGMNHLWIYFSGPEQMSNIQIKLSLPEGILRLKNLNGYPEDESGVIRMDNSQIKHGVIIEIYTQEMVAYEKREISILANYKNAQNQEQNYIHSIPIFLISEDHLSELLIDEEVVSQVKELRNPKENQEWEFIIIPPKIVNHINEFSELEKKYRIDYLY